jgi:hypothetical protein
MLFSFSELIASRASAWTHIASRKHVIHKVYTGSIDEVGGDVMMRGNLELVLKSGAVLEMEFVARMVVDDVLSAEPKFVLCQVWAVWITLFLFEFSCIFKGLEMVY